MERTVSASESYSRAEGVFKLTARCPFCKKINRYDDIEEKTCSHFKTVEHGCGGTIFVFKREEAGDGKADSKGKTSKRVRNR